MENCFCRATARPPDQSNRLPGAEIQAGDHRPEDRAHRVKGGRAEDEPNAVEAVVSGEQRLALVRRGDGEFAEAHFAGVLRLAPTTASLLCGREPKP